MTKVLAISCLLVPAALAPAYPVPDLPPNDVPPSGGLPSAAVSPPTKPPEVPGTMTPAQLLHPDRGSSLLPRRVDTAGLAADSEVLAIQREVDQLRLERQALAAERDRAGTTDSAATDAQEVVRLRARLAELLAKLEAKKAKERNALESSEVLDGPKPEKRLDPPAITGPAAALQTAQDCFRAGDFDGTLRLCRAIDLQTLNSDDRVFVQYLTAGCLRALGHFDDAAALYRAVVDSHADEALVESASWQLHAIEARRNLTRDLAEIRERRQSH
jgi:hypothetical protein